MGFPKRIIAESVVVGLSSELSLLHDAASYSNIPFYDVLRETAARFPEYLKSFVPGNEIVYKSSIFMDKVVTEITKIAITTFSTVGNVVYKTVNEIQTENIGLFEKQYQSIVRPECHLDHLVHNPLLTVILCLEAGYALAKYSDNIKGKLGHAKRTLSRFSNSRKTQKSFDNLGHFLNSVDSNQ